MCVCGGGGGGGGLRLFYVSFSRSLFLYDCNDSEDLAPVTEKVTLAGW